MSEEIEQKKKRRQNVACDSCKFRRIKCDLVQLLCPPELIDDPPPLSKLVLENPGVSCTNCKSKGLDCTTAQILHPSKPNKGGKRIEEARKKFGSASVDPADDQPAPLPSSSGTQQRLSSEFEHLQLMRQILDANIGATPAPAAVPPQPLVNPVQSFANPGGTSSDLPDLQDLQAWTTLFSSTPQTGDAPLPFDPTALNSLPPDIEELLRPTTSQSSTSQSTITPEPVTADMHTLFSAQMDPPMQTAEGSEALRIWRAMEATRSPASRFSQSITTRTTTNIATPQTADREPLEEHVTRDRNAVAIGLAGKSYLQDGSSKTILPHAVYADPVPGMLSSAPSPDRMYPRPRSSGSAVTYLDSSYNASPNPNANPNPLVAIQQLLNNRKRTRGDMMDMPLLKEEAWRIWSQIPLRGYEAKWGRLELVQEKLADRALGVELSRHLIKVFFQAVYFSFPALSPEAFYLEWVRADERSDRMTAAQEALCACIEAWGARYSDSPVVLGLEPDREHEAPKVITQDGKFLPGTQARLHWGKARQSVCKALVVRAKRLLDDHGIFRKPSITGFQALLLYHQLQHTDTNNAMSREHWMEVQMVHSALAEQMEILNLLWTSTMPMPQDEREVPLPAPQQRIRQRRLYFGFLVGDAYYAAAAGRPPRIDDEDVEASVKWMQVSVEALPPSGLRCLAVSMRLYLRLTMVGRRVARELACPSSKKGTIVVPDMCRTVREIWAEIKSILTDVSVEFGEALESCPEPLVGFSPLSNLVNIRLGAPFFLLVIHQLIREQIEFRKQLVGGGSYIVEDQVEASNPQRETIAALETLRLQGVDVMLQICRSEAAMLSTLVPSGMLQSASIFTGVVIAMAQFLAEVPVNEQGYPSDTLGGFGWTWKQKQADMGHCTDTLHQVGWSWPEVGNILDHIHLAMERMQPTPEQFASFKPPPVNGVWSAVAAQQEKIRSFETRTLDIAMQYWPPLSLSDLARRSFAVHRVPATEHPLWLNRWGVGNGQPAESAGNMDSDNAHLSIPAGSNPHWDKLLKDQWVDALKLRGEKNSTVYGPGAQSGSEDQAAWFETALRAMDTVEARHAASASNRSGSGSAETSPHNLPPPPPGSAASAAGSGSRSQTPDERPMKMAKTRPHIGHSGLSHEIHEVPGPVTLQQHLPVAIPITISTATAGGGAGAGANGVSNHPIIPLQQTLVTSQPPLNLPPMPPIGAGAHPGQIAWDFDLQDIVNAPLSPALESPGETMRAFESFLQGVASFNPDQPIQSQSQ